jgi:uncharacterized protein YecE (DUF72 family)
VKGRILVGSCSWTDPSLIGSGRFYPRGVSTAEARLRYYATRFPIVEVDSTYYAPPEPRTSELWVARTPAGFVFDVKAFALLTGHPARPERLPPWLRERLPPDRLAKKNVYRDDFTEEAIDALWRQHRDALAPLLSAAKLGVALFQFPPWFTRSRAHREYLAELPSRLPGVRIAVEFRGAEWMTAENAAKTLATLERAGLAYVTVDEPQGFRSSTPPVVAATTDLAIVRLHGRNAETWEARTSTSTERFKYLYTDGELEEWSGNVRTLAAQAEEVHVLFNNNYEDWGMRNARRMAQLLGVAGGEPDANGHPGPPPAGEGQTRLDVDP